MKKYLNHKPAILYLVLAASVLMFSACDKGKKGANTPPVAVDDTARVGLNGTIDIDVLLNDTDADGDTLEVESITQPANGTADINADDTVRYIPETDYTGTDTFTYTVSDGNGGTDTATVTVAVGQINPDNQPPDAVDDTTATDENTPVTTDVLANDTDPDGDTLTIESFTEPLRGRATDNGDGTLTYAPEDFYNGTDSFTYTVSDGNGGTDTATVTITINPVGEDLYIATDGDDTNPGTMDQPLATLEGAQAAIRDMKNDAGLPDGGVAVWMRQGVYERTATFELTTDDSGTETAPIVYSAFPGETVRIVGGIPLDPAEFSEVTAGSTPDVWDRVDPVAHGHLMQIDMSTYTDDFGQLTFRGFGGWSGGPAALELFFNHQPMQLARWPDADREFPFEVIVTAISDTQFTYDGNRPERWMQAEEVWFHGYWKYMWAEKHMSALSIDTASSTVTLTEVPGYGIDPDQPYYALNLLEEITVPGEWYLNRDTGMLYFWPPDDLAGSEIYVSILEDELIYINSASYITFKDIIFEMGRGDLINIGSGASHNTIEKCVLRNAGLDGAKVRGESNGLNRCEIYEVGNGGVQLFGGDRASITYGNNFVRNCHIHDFSRWVWTYTPAVRIQDAGNEVSHNLMHSAPHTAILFGGNEHLIEFNHIYDVCIWSSDAGAVYTGRDWGFRKNMIRYNFIHHINSSFEGYGTHGVYLDDCVSGISVFGNILYEISGYGIQHGGGRDDFMENNVIVKCGTGLAADSRGISRIVHDGSSWDLLQKIIDMNYQEDPWAGAYPRLAAIPNTWAEVSNPDALWLYPEGCVFSRNIGFSNETWMREGNYGGTGTLNKYEEIADNIEDQDPLFVDEANLDMTLHSDSPAFTIPGFEDIPFDQIGIEPEE